MILFLRRMFSLLHVKYRRMVLIHVHYDIAALFSELTLRLLSVLP